MHSVALRIARKRLCTKRLLNVMEFSSDDDLPRVNVKCLTQVVVRSSMKLSSLTTLRRDLATPREQDGVKIGVLINELANLHREAATFQKLLS